MPFRRRDVKRRVSFTELVIDIAANPRVLLIEVGVVVLLSSVFEAWERYTRRKLARGGSETGAEVMNTLFKEITVLGFVAFVIFVVSHSGVADVLTPLIFKCDTIYTGSHNTLAFTFEVVHMMIFMLLLVLLAQAAAMYFCSKKIADTWGNYERTVSSGDSQQSLEKQLVQHGYLRRTEDPEAPNGFKLEQAREFDYGQSFLGRALLRRRPLHKLIMWRAIRHEFLFPSATSKGVSVAVDPSVFSFAEYLRQRLGKVIVSLIHVDRWTWAVSLLLLAGPLYFCRWFPNIPHEAVHCVLVWGLFFIGVAMAVALESDTFRFTPAVPKDGRKIMKLFSRESFQTLRRTKLPGFKGSKDSEQADEEQPKLGLPPAVQKGSTRRSSQGFRNWFRMLSFMQAVSVTSLVLSHWSDPVTGLAETIFYYLAWLEWPLMMLWIVPVIVRRLTVRSSIHNEKDNSLIRKVTTETKQSLLRDYGRLVQLIGFEARAVKSKEPWTMQGSEAWPRKKAIQFLLLGLKKFDKLSTIEKREIFALFGAWDGNGQGVVDSKDLVETFTSMGAKDPERAIENLIRSTDFDSSGTVNWMKFKALFGLATANRPLDELRDDLEASFDFMDKDSSGDLTIFELYDGFQRMHFNMGVGDMANLLFLHFGEAKPNLGKHDFADWIMADRASLAAAIH